MNTLETPRFEFSPAGHLGPHRAAVTERRGGVSEGPLRSLNLGRSVTDLPERVTANEARALDALGLPDRVARIRLEHGRRVLRPAGPGLVGPADALLTSDPGLVLALTVADCFPLALTAGPLRMLGHCGWRGVADGIVEAMIAAIGDALAEAIPSRAPGTIIAGEGSASTGRAGSATAGHESSAGAGHEGSASAGRTLGAAMAAGEVRAWIGPGIGPCCYEVGPEVAARFPHAIAAAPGQSGADPRSRAAAPGKPLAAASGEPLAAPWGEPLAAPLGANRAERLDLRLEIRRRLLALGIAPEAIAASDACTACAPHRFFSHRRDGFPCGRMAAILWAQPLCGRASASSSP